MKDKFNKWQVDSLFNNYEEGENSNYVDKDIDKYVKRSTLEETSIRAMRQTAKLGYIYAIQSINTNDAGLFGIARSGSATKRRITLIVFKEYDQADPNPGFDWRAEDDNVADESFT
jgi:hypothetical protein